MWVERRSLLRVLGPEQSSETEWRFSKLDELEEGARPKPSSTIAWNMPFSRVKTEISVILVCENSPERFNKSQKPWWCKLLVATTRTCSWTVWTVLNRIGWQWHRSGRYIVVTLCTWWWLLVCCVYGLCRICTLYRLWQIYTPKKNKVILAFPTMFSPKPICF